MCSGQCIPLIQELLRLLELDGEEDERCLSDSSVAFTLARDWDSVDAAAEMGYGVLEVTEQ